MQSSGGHGNEGKTIFSVPSPLPPPFASPWSRLCRVCARLGAVLGAVLSAGLGAGLGAVLGAGLGAQRVKENQARPLPRRKFSFDAAFVRGW